VSTVNESAGETKKAAKKEKRGREIEIEKREVVWDGLTWGGIKKKRVDKKVTRKAEERDVSVSGAVIKKT